MEITWWGTAGFRIKSGKNVFLIDPYLTRNKKAEPAQYLKASDIAEGELMFLSHGHFDHLYDVPTIAKTNSSMVYCSKEASETLQKGGLNKKQIFEITSDGFIVDFFEHQAQAFFSKHVIFDKKLILKTLLRTNVKFFKHLHLLRDFPMGQVLSWRFNLEGTILHHFGSGGSPPEEMEKLAILPTDILLVPLQEHSDICNIALEYVQVMQPKVVIPHHQDNFYPPLSRSIDIQPFIEGVKRECPKTQVLVMEMNETITL